MEAADSWRSLELELLADDTEDHLKSLNSSNDSMNEEVGADDELSRNTKKSFK